MYSNCINYYAVFRTRSYIFLDLTPGTRNGDLWRKKETKPQTQNKKVLNQKRTEVISRLQDMMPNLRFSKFLVQVV